VEALEPKDTVLGGGNVNDLKKLPPNVVLAATLMPLQVDLEYGAIRG